jgi:hypothetical protein
VHGECMHYVSSCVPQNGIYCMTSELLLYNYVKGQNTVEWEEGRGVPYVCVTCPMQFVLHISSVITRGTR